VDPGGDVVGGEPDRELDAAAVRDVIGHDLRSGGGNDSLTLIGVPQPAAPAV
jgi:hypothetical protein